MKKKLILSILFVVLGCLSFMAFTTFTNQTKPSNIESRIMEHYSNGTKITLVFQRTGGKNSYMETVSIEKSKDILLINKENEIIASNDDRVIAIKLDKIKGIYYRPKKGELQIII